MKAAADTHPGQPLEAADRRPSDEGRSGGARKDTIMERWLFARRAVWMRAVLVVVASLTVYTVVVQLLTIHALWTPTGYVDTWPLYDRLFKLSNGELSLTHYLLDPHVHPHAIIFFLYLLDAKLGMGQQILPHVATIVSILGLIVVFGMLVARSDSLMSKRELTTWIAILGSAVLISGVSEASIIPFQAVVIVTRFIYVGLLAGLAYAQVHRRDVLHAVLLAASAVAVSFYASGGVFAGEIILLHALYIRRWGWLIASVLPLVVYLALIAGFTHPSAESNELVKMLHDIDGRLLLETFLGIPAYYASALVAGWPADIGPDYTLGKTLLMAVGLVVFAVTTTWSGVTLLVAFWEETRRPGGTRRVGWASCVLALVAVWVALSSVSASLLWIARARILGDVFTQAPHYLVLTSNRYAAFAALSYAILFVIIGSIAFPRVRMICAAALFTLVCVVALVSVDSTRFAVQKAQIDRVDLAATALLMGLPVTSPEGEAVWPGVSHDWYWPKELLRTTAYLRSAHLAYNSGLPAIGVAVTGTHVDLAQLTSSPAATEPSVCRISAKLDRPVRRSFWAPRHFFPLIDNRNEVVGYATTDQSDVEGYADCNKVKDGELFVAKMVK